MAYCLLAELKTEQGITTTSDDTLLQQCLDDAQAFIEGPAGANRLFQVSVDTTRYADAPYTIDPYDFDGPNYLLLLHDIGDLCSITSVVNGDGTTVSSSAYVTEPRYHAPYHALRLKRYGGVIWTYSSTAEASIAITGKWGYSTTAPDDIHKAHKRLAAYYYRNKNQQSDLDRPLLHASGTAIMPIKVPPEVMSVLEAYRKLA